MNVCKKLLWLGTILLALIGLFSCIGGIVGVWTLKSRADRVAAAALDASDDALGFVDAKVDRVKEIVELCQRRVGGFSTLGERLKIADADARKECEPLLEMLKEVHQELTLAQSWLDSSHAVASGINRISAAVVSSEFAASHQDLKVLELAADVQEFAGDLAEALAKLQAMRAELVQLLDTGKLGREAVAGIVMRLADLNGRLARMADRVENLDKKIAATRASCADLARRFNKWTLDLAATVSLVLAWFAVSQIVMAVWGWRKILVRSR